MSSAVATQDKEKNQQVNLTIQNGIWQANDWLSLHHAGTILSKSQWTPEHFRGKPGDCAICIIMAGRVGMDPISFMQSTYAVHGKIGLEAKLAIALLRRSGLIKGTIKYEVLGTGDEMRCIASVVDTESGATISDTVSFKMAKAEGWVEKKGSKWKTLPELMLKYRAATFLIRTHYPDVLMGLYTTEELKEMDGAPVAVEGQVVQPRTIADLHSQLSEGEPEAEPEADEDTAEFELIPDPVAPENASLEQLEEIEGAISSLQTQEAVCDMAEHLAGQYDGDEQWCDYIDAVAKAKIREIQG